MVLFNKINIIKNVFPNNEKQYVDLTSTIRNSPTNIFTLIFEDNSDLFDLIMMKKWFDDIADREVHCNLVIEFCPYGQSDRKMNEAIFSFKYFAQIINSLNFNRVVIYDPHSLVMEGALIRCDASYPMTGVNLNNYDLIFYPDNGAAKKYSEIYNKPYRFGNKKRNLDTGEIICYEIIADKEDIINKKILIRDDLCMGGRTFKEATKALYDMGAKQVDLYITHLMPQAEDFYKSYEEYGIVNFYSDNTLRQEWYR